MSEALSRREFLIVGALSGAALLASGGIYYATSRPESKPLPVTPPPKPTPLVNIFENSLISLGAEESIPLSNWGIKYTPDGHIPYVTLPDSQREYYFSGNASSYAFKRGSSPNLYESIKHDANSQALPAIKADKSRPYRNGYTSICSVFPDIKQPDHLFALTHCEEWLKDSTEKSTFSIGLVESFGGGDWLEKRGPVLQAKDALRPGEKFTGVGQPCAVVRKEGGDSFVYVYYLYLPAASEIPNQICLSRALLKEGDIGEFEHFTKDGFRKTEITADTVNGVITPPRSIPGSSYAALPSISFNKYLNRYLGIFETQQGFCTTSSEDGLSWKEGELFLKFDAPQEPHFKGQVWTSNPTLWSEDEATDQITGKSGYLVYSKGTWDEPHKMYRRSFQLK